MCMCMPCVYLMASKPHKIKHQLWTCFVFFNSSIQKDVKTTTNQAKCVWISASSFLLHFFSQML